MGRKPCCAKEGVNRGAWTLKEDRILIDYINIHGQGKWRDLPQKAGLNRCGKSCRLRWLNYLRPDIKRGNISVEEEELIMRLHNLLGNRWSLIAGRLPGRTDNEIKNYWNTNLSKRMQTQKTQNSIKQENNLKVKEKIVEPHQVIRTKAVKCTKVIIPWHLDNQIIKKNERKSPSTSTPPPPEGDCNDFLMDCDNNDLSISDFLNLEFSQESSENANGVYRDCYGMNIVFDSEFPTSTNDEAMVNINKCANEEMLDDWKVMIDTFLPNEDWEPHL